MGRPKGSTNKTKNITSDDILDKAKNSFPFFLTIVWHAIGLPKPTPIQTDFAVTLQNPPSKSMILEAFRGMGKSFILCAFACWVLWNDRDKKIMIVSASKERADANALFIKKILTAIPFLEGLLPDKGQRDTRTVFDISGCLPDNSPSVKSIGITGQITGSRADIIIADDVESFNNSYTQGQRDKLFESVKEFDAVLKPGGQIFFLGTPQTESTLYNELPHRGYTLRIWPARYPYDLKQRRNYISDEHGDRLAPYIADRYDSNPDEYASKPTDPLRFDDDELNRKELSYNKIGFLLQFMLDTNLSDEDKYPLKLRDFIVAELSKEAAPMKLSWLPNDKTKVNDIPIVGLKGDCYYTYFNCSDEIQPYAIKIMTIDPSGKGKDETAYSVGYFLNGYIFIVDCGGFTNGYDEVTLTKLAKIAKEYKVSSIIVEGNYGSGMWTQLFRPVLFKHHKCSVEDINSKGQKELRIIDTLEPVLASHKLVIDKRCVINDYNSACNSGEKKYSLMYQLTRVTRDRGCLEHDDRLDSLSMMVDFFNDLMCLDDDIGIENLTEEWDVQNFSYYSDFSTNIVNGMMVTDVDEYNPYWRNKFKNAKDVKELYKQRV